jgi:chromosome partitioning protein
VHDVQRLTNPALSVMGVLPTLYDGRTVHTRAVLADISSRYSLDVLEPPIPRSIRFAEAPATGQTIMSTARRTSGADAYRALARRIAGVGCPEPATRVQAVSLDEPSAAESRAMPAAEPAAHRGGEV